MIKKATLLFMFIVFIMTLFGCETAKGALKGGVEGAKKDWETTKDVGTAATKGVGMAAKGVGTVAKGVGTALMRTDEWMQKNLW